MYEKEPVNITPENLPPVDQIHTTAGVLDAQLDTWTRTFDQVSGKAKKYLEALTLVTVLAGGVSETAQAEVPIREINQAHEVISGRRIEHLKTDLKELTETLKQLELEKAEALKDQEQSLKFIFSDKNTNLSNENIANIHKTYTEEIAGLDKTIAEIQLEIGKTEKRIERNKNRQELLADALSLSGIANQYGYR
ncbi:hypothetical protein COY25_03240 [Candidatus Uhrbacteria bacterium CG_4_10_14_0_2_um_filter_41_7]|uniref:Uncharacterized protein n=1 Tax=Candidatus Uhrbacteria bacterium CG_4_9_14_3_um_filter_41_35 TaxID=1975034 RepID=A0A2M7XGR0_9BACT|nr:MAG: hypothetical protein COV92_00590 [Candidatus Uhrbacteria bacterium CG11_big_fil_rev_8_21_14_0_20_41_9]PIZ53607.1 MAG: hypothetical protein COY25_03240 [Candidatus Uhrbacteria bacterium CG_4_10_14_0_2_um_filter_41_7]PJA47070.1 MAG: hypothetical protein CO173_00195 [Candidatus Uhrbacteria bacterium CG_4_9_14_3_um_filter_41_35]